MATTVTDLAAFTQRRLADLTRLYVDTRDDHQNRAWARRLTDTFTADELELLDRRLTDQDRLLLKTYRQETQ